MPGQTSDAPTAGATGGARIRAVRRTEVRSRTSSPKVTTVREWPPIAEPELLERLALDHDEFVAFYRTFAAALGHREFGPALLQRALGYPWSRPERSYLLRGADLWLLDDLAPAARRSTVQTFAQDRHPILAIGSNAAPTPLTLQFAH